MKMINMRNNLFLITIMVCFLFLSGRAQPGSKDRVFKGVDDSWVDSVMATMSPEERIGQLFMIPVYSNRDISHRDEITAMIDKFHLGGLIFMQGGPVRQVRMTNHFQSRSEIPLLISMDAEWGLDMRLDSVPKLPRQLMLGAIQKPGLIKEYGKVIAAQLKRMGVHMSFSPVVDVNNNPDNPVINDRSFGENRYNVTLRGLQYMKGLQQNGIIACAKHFPGHGDTDVDSHKDLPVIRHDRQRLDSIEMWPFKILIRQGVMSVMVAHLFIPALDPAQNIPTTLSSKVVEGILREELNFDGLIITDALNMKGASEFGDPATVAYKALLAGNDILLFPGDIPGTIQLIKKGLANKEITQEEIDRRVRKILRAKYWAGLHQWTPVSTAGIYEDLNNDQVESLHFRLAKNALTLARNGDNLIPFEKLDSNRYAAVAIGTQQENTFQEILSKYVPVSKFQVAGNAQDQAFSRIYEKVKNEPVVIVSLHDMSRYSSRGFGISSQTKRFLKLLQKQTQVVLVVFGTPYSLTYFNDFQHVVVAYEDHPYSQSLAAQLLCGGSYAHGLLPVSASPDFNYGDGNIINHPIRMGYSMPEAVGMNSEILKNIDRIALDAISMKATPGMQVLALKDGYIIYDKAFGYHTYDKEQPVKPDHLYDIASITKIAATTISLMYLYDQGKFRLDAKLSDYLPELESSNFANVEIKKVLTHTAGLKAWIPFFLNTLTMGSLYQSYYCYDSDDYYCIPVADDIYLRSDYIDSIRKIIINSEIKHEGEYRYSDLGFYLFPEIIKVQSGQPIEDFVQTSFYQPMNLKRITYTPLENGFSLAEIVPTEIDDAFRKQLIHGFVHDQGAAMLGGISGHAGLFSTARDLATIMQMLLNGGTYGGKRYLEESTIELFTSRHHEKSRRGFGFDKPLRDTTKNGPTAPSASQRSYGHSGFTGTGTWADPETGIVYVILSNRVHPTSENKKFVREDIRTRIHQVLYDALQPEATYRNIAQD